MAIDPKNSKVVSIAIRAISEERYELIKIEGRAACEEAICYGLLKAARVHADAPPWSKAVVTLLITEGGIRQHDLVEILTKQLEVLHKEVAKYRKHPSYGRTAKKGR